MEDTVENTQTSGIFQILQHLVEYRRTSYLMLGKNLRVTTKMTLFCLKIGSHDFE
jgi:hypothetical protein